MSEAINIGAILEALNDKADRDLGNVADFSQEQWDRIIDAVAPDMSRGEDKEFNVEYTSESAGWVLVYCGTYNGVDSITIDGVEYRLNQSSNDKLTSTQFVWFMRKGTVWKVNPQRIIEGYYVKWFYCSKS